MMTAALMMLVATLAGQTQAPASTPAPAAQPPAATPDLPALDARLGPCSADFVVTTPEGTPIYLALVHVNVRYGAMGIKRMDLEVGTNSEGKARIKGLPEKARPMTYDVQKDDKKTTVNQDVAKTCEAKLEIVLK